MPRPRRSSPWRVVGALSATSLISWGTLYYAFSTLLLPMARDEGWQTGEMVAAFSTSLLISGIGTYRVGALIARVGGRAVMTAGSLAAAVALWVISSASSIVVFWLGWALAGLAMAATLYEAAFAALATVEAGNYRRAVTIVTLAGGLASTVFWPLTERLEAWLGWREALLVYVALHLVVCAPLHLVGLPAHVERRRPREAERPALSFRDLLRDSSLTLLATSFTLTGIVVSIVSVHLVPLLQARGMSALQAAWVASVAGPLQVAGRIMEFVLGDRSTAARTGLVALAVLVVAAGTLAVSPLPVPLALAGVGLYGVSNGVLTIIRSLTIVELFGRDEYPRVSGALLGPAIVARAVGPYLAALVLAAAGDYTTVMMLTVAVAIAAVVLFARATRLSHS